MNKQETIQKLESIEEMLLKCFELNEYIESGYLEEEKQEVDKIKNELGNFNHIPKVFENFPILYASNEAQIEELSAKKAKFFNFLKISLIATLILILLCFIPKLGSILNSIRSISIVVSAVIGYLFYSTNKKFKNANEAEQKAKNEFENTYKAFVTHLENYDNEKKNAIEGARKYGEKYREAYIKQEEMLISCGQKKLDAMDDLLNTHELIEKESPVPAEYQHFIPALILYLKSGRADTLKEALNLAIEEERIRERDEAMLAEERRRTAIEQQRQENERRHQLEMERQADMQTRAAQDQARAAENQARATENASRRAASAEATAKNNAYQRCTRCANFDACGRNRGIPNCGAFRAK